MPHYNAHIVNGYYDYGYKTVFVDERLPDMPYAQAGIRNIDGHKVLVSYDTEVLVMDKYFSFRVYCMCSSTTRRHISSFLRSYIGDFYQEAKKAYLTDTWYSPVTNRYYTDEEYANLMEEVDA